MKKLFTMVILAAALAVSATAAPKHAPKAQAVKITGGPRVEGTGPTWAVIAWTTNTGGSSVIRYGTDANNLSQTAKSAYADNENTKSPKSSSPFEELEAEYQILLPGGFRPGGRDRD